MSEIVWFPGHMAKARRKIKEILPLIDVVIEIVDARIPVSSRNPDFGFIFKAKPCLVVLSKASLADPAKTKKFEELFSAGGNTAVSLDCRENPDMKTVTRLIKSLAGQKLKRDSQKNITRPVRCLVAGITNVGKSTFINTYTKTKKAKTEDRPGITRRNFWIASPHGVEMLDTPGLLWHKFDDPEVGLKLAATGAITDDILDMPRIAAGAVGLMRKDGGYKALLEKRYKINIKDNDTDFKAIENIAASRGFIVSGGELDIDRAARVFLDEFRGGRIGRITLD